MTRYKKILLKGSSEDPKRYNRGIQTLMLQSVSTDYIRMLIHEEKLVIQMSVDRE